MPESPADAVDAIGWTGHEPVLELGPGPGLMRAKAQRTLDRAGYPGIGVHAGDAGPRCPSTTAMSPRGSAHPHGRVACIDIVAKVKPGSRKGPLVEIGPDGQLTIYVRERAVDGKANAAVIRVLAEHLDVPRSSVELVAGATARLKRFRVS